jgi:hypothetical protein
VPAETIVPNAKEYISETIDDPEAIYDPEIWGARRGSRPRSRAGVLTSGSPAEGGGTRIGDGPTLPLRRGCH